MNSTSRFAAAVQRRQLVYCFVLTALMPPLWASGQAAQDKEPSRHVFVPVEELDAVLERDKQGVILPVAEFKDLLRKAAGNAGRPDGVGIEHADYVARTTNSQLLIEARIRLRQFADGWHAIALRTGGLSVESARLNDEQAPLGRTGPDTVQLLTNRAGINTLVLTLSAPLVQVGSDLVSGFQLPAAAAADFQVSVPAGKQLLVDGLLIARPGPAEEAATVSFPVGGRAKLELRITERARSEKSEALVFMSTAYGVNVAPSEITWQAVTTLQSFGEAVDKFRFSVPNTLEIAAVESTGLEAWELNDDAGQTRTEITLTYRQPIEGSRKITFRGVMAVPVNQEWSLPGLSLKAAASQVGRVIVRHPPGTRLVVENLSGVRRTADTDAQQRVAHASFDIWQRDFDLKLRLQLREREVLADLSTIVDVAERSARLQTLATIECLNAPLFEVVTSLPAEWQPVGMTLNNQPISWQPIIREPGRSFLKVTFPQPLQPGVEAKLNVSAIQDLVRNETEDASFALPEVRIEGAGVVEGILLIRAPDWLRLTPQEVTGLDPAVLPNVSGRHLGFRYQDSVFSGTIASQPKATRLAAWTYSSTRLEPEKLMTWLDVHLQVAGGGLRELRVQLPEAVGTDVRFRIVENTTPPAAIQEQVVEATENGLNRWLIRFDRRLRGNLTLSSPLEAARDEAANPVPAITIVGADRQYGFVAIEAAAEQHLTMDLTDAAGSQVVDPADLPESRYTPQERIVAAYRYVRPGFAVAINEERFDREAVPTAVCREMRLDTLIGESGDVRHHARARLVAVGIQNLRLRLPEQTVLWATEVDGRPVEVRRDGTEFLIPLRDQQQPDAERQVRLTYASTADPLELFGQLNQSAPVFSVEVDGTSQPVETLTQRWDVHHPQQTRFSGSEGRFEPRHDAGSEGWLARLPRLIRMPNATNAAQKLLAIVFTFVVVAVPTLCFRRWKLKGFVTCLAIMAFTVGFGYALLLQSGAPVPQAMEVADVVSPGFYGSDEAEAMTDLALSSAGSEDRRSNFAADAPAGEPAFADMERSGEKTVAPSETPRAAAQSALPGRESKSESSFRLAQDLPQAGGRQQAANGDEDISAGAGRADTLPGGRLSVPVQLQIPATAVTTQFEYAGTGRSSQADLSVGYFNARLGSVLRIAVALFVALLLWWRRRASAGLRVLLVTAGLLVTTGIAPLLDAVGQLAVEGAFFGTLAGLLLWVLQGLTGQIRRLRGPQPTVAAVLLATIAAASATAQEKPDQVLVPYSGEGLPGSAERVFLPHAQFLELWRRANPERARAHSPQPGLVSSATYLAELQQRPGGSFVRLKSRFTVHNFRSEQVRVTLPIGSLPIEKAELNGERAPLHVQTVRVEVPAPNQAQRGQNKRVPITREQLTVLLTEPGVAVLDIDFLVPVIQTGPAGRFVLPLKPVGAAVLGFRLPAEDLQVRVNGSTTSWRTREPGVVQFPASGGGTFSVEWQPRDQETGLDRVVHTEIVSAAAFDDAGLRVRTRLGYTVRQGSLSEIAFDVPAGVALQQVTGADVGGWQQTVTGEVRTVRVFLRRSVDAATAITVELYANPDITNERSEISIPTVRPREITRESGSLAVYSTDAITVRTASVTGARQVNPDDFQVPAEFGLGNQKPVLAWRYSVRPFSVAVTAIRPSERLDAAAVHAVFVERHKTRFTSRFKLRPSGAPRARLTVVLPEGFLPLEVHATGIADWYPHRDESGVELLIVDLQQPTLADVELIVTGTMTRDATAQTASVPVPRMNEVTRSSAQIGIRVDRSYTASVGDAGNWNSIAPENTDADIRGLAAEPIRFAFVTEDPQPAPISLQLSEVPPTLFGESVSIINMTDTSVEYSLNLKWILRQSSADSFTFSAPDWLAGKLEFQADGLRQIVESAPENGRVTWTLVLQEARTDQFFALALATFPPVLQQNLRTPELRFEAQVGTVQVQNHYALAVNQSQRLISPVGNHRSARREDMQITIPEGFLNRATDIVTVPAGNPPEWSVSTPERREAAPAIVNLADLRTIVAGDGTWRTTAAYTIRNRTRQFLPVALPEGSELLSVYVGDQPSRPVVTTRNQREVHLIALPRTSEVDLSVTVRVVLAGAVNLPTARGLSGIDIEFPRPEIVAMTDDPQFGIPVSMTVWAVHTPKTWRASPVLRSGRTNMTLNEQGGSETIRVMATLKDAVEQSMTFQGGTPATAAADLSSKMRLFDNLKSVEQKVAQSELAGDRGLVRDLDELRSNLIQLKSDLAREGVRFNADDSIANPETLRVDKEAAQQGFVADFNNALIGSNSAQGLSQRQELEENFKFGLQPNKFKGRPESKTAKPAGEIGNTRNRSGSKVFGNLQSQIALPGGDTGVVRGLGMPDQAGMPPGPVGGGGGGFGGGGLGGGVQLNLPQRSGAPDADGTLRFNALQDSLGAPQEEADFEFDSSPVPPAEWTTVGGLSLPIELETDEPALTFSKVGGSPRLTLRFRPAESVQKGFGAAWAFVWVGLALAALVAFRRRGARGLGRFVPGAMAVVGLIGFAVLPADFAAGAFVLFTLGAIGLAFAYRKPEVAA